MESITITFPDDFTTKLVCHKCGSPFLQRIGEIRNKPSIKCPICGETINTDSQEVRESIEARGKEIVNLLKEDFPELELKIE